MSKTFGTPKTFEVEDDPDASPLGQAGGGGGPLPPGQKPAPVAFGNWMMDWASYWVNQVTGQVSWQAPDGAPDRRSAATGSARGVWHRSARQEALGWECLHQSAC